MHSLRFFIIINLYQAPIIIVQIIIVCMRVYNTGVAIIIIIIFLYTTLFWP